MASPRRVAHGTAAETAPRRPKGRGTASNPANRFESLHYASDPDLAPVEDEPAPDPRTQYIRDPSRSIVATNTSPDVGFDASVNPYRGCTHGCSYCYARPFHEYLGFSAGLDFETKILVKSDAPGLLRKKLASKGWKPQVLALSGVTDPYQPVERKLEITRGLLEVLLEFRNPVAIITKNALVTRDLDLLAELARLDCAAVSLSVTTVDPKLQQVMEPRTSPPHRRLEAIERLAKAGVPTGVMVAPVIPGLTDHEVPAIVEAAANAGATRAGTVVLRLPHAVRGLMEDWLEAHFPERKEKVLNRLRALHGEELYRGRFRLRQRGEGFFAVQMQQVFDAACRRHGIVAREGKLSTAHFRRPGAEQLGLF